MNIETYYHSAFDLDGKIMVVGGRSKSGEDVTQIESFNSFNGTWSIVGNTSNDWFDYLNCSDLKIIFQVKFLLFFL